MEWDYKIGDDIPYFDAEKSYELTGYRPINKTMGLDFNPDWFREAAISKLTTGTYSGSVYGSRSYKEFWDTQKKRCNEGYSSHGYRLTGDNYFFLNFYNLKTSESDTINQAYGFPMFLVFQYEYFHYVELCEKLGYDVALLKSRGIGFSEMASSFSTRPYTTIPNYRIMVTAFSKGHLDPTLEKMWYQLDWLNEHTEGAFRRVRMNINTKMHKRASVKNRDLSEEGHMSEIQGIVVDEPDKLRGDRVQKLIFEECFGKGTKVRMFDLSVKNIEDIVVGDCVLGPKGEKQLVYETHSGKDVLYRVDQKRGCSYTVTHNHPLYLERRPRVGNQKDEIKLITPTEYLNFSKYNKRTTYGLQAGVIDLKDNFESPLDPYYLGLWLGDGHSDRNDIVVNKTDDIEIGEFLYEYAESLDYGIEERNNNSPSKNCVIKNYHLSSPGQNNIVTQGLRDLGMLNNKHIPNNLNYLSQKNRLRLLAGLIDSDGSLSKSSSYSFYYEITMSREWLIDEILLLARLSGFDVKKSSKKGSGHNKKGNFYRVVIKGDIAQIPVKVQRKKIPENYKKTNKINSTGFTLTEEGEGRYYGIKLKQQGNGDSDHLFLLEDFTIVHNCGADPALGKKWVKGEALITVLGGKRVGMRIAFGTGGSSKASSMAGLKAMIEAPEASNILPVRHNYTADRRYVITGLFIPAYRVVYQFVDERGYCDEQRSIAWYEAERKKKGGDPKALLDYKAEYCFTIEEALIQKEGNVFPVEELANQLSALDVYKTVEKPKTGFLVWEINRDSQRTGKVVWREDPKGNIIIKEPPILGESGHGYRNLYVGGIDSIDIGEQDSATQDKSKLSDFCVVIKKRVLGLETPAYVAMYKDRPRDIREAYENAAKLLTWYEAQAVLEATRTAITTYFRNKNYLHLLMRRPRATTSNITKTNTTMYGTPTPPRVIAHYVELVYDFCLDYAQTMNFREMLDQLVNYSDEAKKKFDIVAAMGMAELADEELSTRKPVEIEPVHKAFQDFGWWTDANGYKHYGAIPQNEQERYEQQRIRKEDSWLYS